MSKGVDASDETIVFMSMYYLSREHQLLQDIYVKLLKIAVKFQILVLKLVSAFCFSINLIWGCAHEVMHGLPWSAQGTKKILLRFFIPFLSRRFHSFLLLPVEGKQLSRLNFPRAPSFWNLLTSW